jgi:hypothetical protein
MLVKVPQPRLWTPSRTRRRHRKPSVVIECAAPTVVQTAYTDNFSGTTTTIATYGSAQSAGDTNLVLIGWPTTGTELPTNVGDTEVNSYSLLGSYHDDSAAFYAIAVYMATGIEPAGAGANAVTVIFAIANNYEVYIVETSPSLLDTTFGLTFNSNGSSTPATTGPTSTGKANVLALAYCLNGSNVTGPGSGWSLDSKSPTSFGSGLETQSIAVAGTAVTATFPLASAANWIQVMLGLYTPPTSPVIVPFTALP